MTSSSRITHWFTVAAFSTIALVSIVNDFPEGQDIKDQEDYTKWVVSAMSIGLTFSALGVFANFLLKEKFEGQLLEGGLALLTCGFWAGAIPAIMDPDNRLAVTVFPLTVGQTAIGTSAIFNNNLYFFSWGAFIMSFYVLFGVLKEKAKLTVPQVYAWASITLTSFVVFVAAARQYDDWDCDQDATDVEDQCKRTKLAVSVGVLSGFIGLVWALLGCFVAKRWSKFASILDLTLTWFIFVLWIFAIIYVTFGGEQRAVRALGNLYFFTWASFFLSGAMAMTSLKNVFTGGDEDEVHEEGEPAVKEPAPKEAPMDEPVIEAEQEDKGENLSEMEA